MIPYFDRLMDRTFLLTAIELTLYAPMLNLLRTPSPLAILSAITPFGSGGEKDPWFFNNSVIPL